MVLTFITVHNSWTLH